MKRERSERKQRTESEQRETKTSKQLDDNERNPSKPREFEKSRHSRLPKKEVFGQIGRPKKLAIFVTLKGQSLLNI